MDMAYVKVYADWTRATAKLKDAEKGRLIDTMVVYATTGEDRSDALCGNEQYLFPVFQASIDRDRQALAELSKRQSENGKKGGRGHKKATALNEKPENPPLFPESQKNEEKEKEKEKEKEYYSPLTPQGEDNNDDLWINAALNDQVYQAAEGIGLAGTTALQHADRLIADYSAEWVLEAIHRASLAAKSAWSWRYIESILQNWKKSGGIEDRKPIRDEPETSKPKYRWVGDDDDDEKPSMFEVFVDEQGYERVRLRS